MCQLLGMNSLKPARLDFSLAGFLLRGGETDEHADGWGAAFFEESGCRLLVDEQASARSPLAKKMRECSTWARNIIVHIRKATQGAVKLQNCHPFMRTLWGREWAFAHNGNLNLSDVPMPQAFRPVGETDSERAFCMILERLQQRFGDHFPVRADFIRVLAEVGDELARYGTFNFVLSDGEMLAARCATELHYVQRAFPFGRARLLDCKREIEFAQHNQADDRMVIVATRPLTDECWQPIPQGKLVVFVEGRLLETVA